MSFAYGNNQSDDYNKDIKLDESITLPQSSSSLVWMKPTPMNNNFPLHFAATFWDKTVRIFEVKQNQSGGTIMQVAIASVEFPPVCCEWNMDNSCLYIGCANGTIKTYDINTASFGNDFGKQSASISTLNYAPNLNCLISTGYERSVNFWQGQPNPVMSIDVGNKIFCSDLQNNVMAGAILGEQIFFIDLNNVGQGEKTILDSADLGKTSQLNTVSLDKKAETIGFGTADGRSNISSILKNSGQFKLNSIITFKSNKQEENGSTILYPVNTSSFSSMYQNWFMTAGGDGVMSFWDYKARNKIRSFQYSGNPVCNATVSPSGSMVAYSLGNDWHVGEQGIGKWKNKIGVHLIADDQTKFQGNSKK